MIGVENELTTVSGFKLTKQGIRDLDDYGQRLRKHKAQALLAATVADRATGQEVEAQLEAQAPLPVIAAAGRDAQDGIK